MQTPRVLTRDEFRDRAKAVRDQFAASGTNVSEWARANGFTPHDVHQVLAGDRLCIRGKSFRISVALGIREAAPPPAIPGNRLRMIDRDAPRPLVDRAAS